MENCNSNQLLLYKFPITWHMELTYYNNCNQLLHMFSIMWFVEMTDSMFLITWHMEIKNDYCTSSPLCGTWNWVIITAVTKYCTGSPLRGIFKWLAACFILTATRNWLIMYNNYNQLLRTFSITWHIDIIFHISWPMEITNYNCNELLTIVWHVAKFYVDIHFVDIHFMDNNKTNDTGINCPLNIT